VNVVCTRLHDRVELTGVRVPKFRTKLIRQGGEFLHSVVRDDNQRTGHALIVVVDPFNREIVVARPLATDRWPCPGANAAACTYSGLQQGQIQYSQTLRGHGQIRRDLCVKRIVDLRVRGVD